MRRTSRRKGSAMLETAMMMPLIVLLLVGMGQLARVTYTYYTLRKTVYSIATYLAAQQGVNFCDPADPTVAAAINFGLTGSSDGSLPVFVTGLTPAMIQVTPEALDPTSNVPGSYGSACGATPAFDGQPPDQILVSIPNGYLLQLRIPFLPLDPIALKPEVKVPYVGT